MKKADTENLTYSHLNEDTEACARRVVRGGGWINVPGGVRSADRFRLNPDEASVSQGFRLARDL